MRKQTTIGVIGALRVKTNWKDFADTAKICLKDLILIQLINFGYMTMPVHHVFQLDR